MLTVTKLGKAGASDQALASGSGGGSGNATGASTTNRPRSVSDAAKAINSQVKAGAEQLDRTVKKLTGADKQKAEGDSTGGTTN